MTDEELLVRANRAKEVLDNPLLIEALAHYEQEITSQWKASPLRDVEGRERLRLMLAAHEHFQSYLTSTMEAGKLARVRQPTIPERVMSLVGRG
jgi:hypothetical protein